MIPYAPAGTDLKRLQLGVALTLPERVAKPTHYSASEETDCFGLIEAWHDMRIYPQVHGRITQRQWHIHDLLPKVPQVRRNLIQRRDQALRFGNLLHRRQPKYPEQDLSFRRLAHERPITSPVDTERGKRSAASPVASSAASSGARSVNPMSPVVPALEGSEVNSPEGDTAPRSDSIVNERHRQDLWHMRAQPDQPGNAQAHRFDRKEHRYQPQAG